MAAAVSLNTTVVARSDLAQRKLADEAVVLDPTSGRYFGLSEVAARIWELIQQPRTARAVRDALVQEYAVKPEPCERDLLTLLGRLLEEHLIEVTDDCGR